MTSATAIPFPELLEPIDGAHPCGANLEYEPAFIALQAKVAVRPEVQYGQFLSVPEAVNWREVEHDCRVLLQRTRDMRLLVLLARCGARLGHAAGLRDGLSALAHLLEKWPDALHPQPMIDGEADPVLRASALAALADPHGLMRDVRELVIDGNGPLALHMRDIEKAMARTRPADALPPESVAQQLAALRARQDAGLAALDAARSAVLSIDHWARQHLAEDRPDLQPLLQLLGLVASKTVEAEAPAATPEACGDVAAPGDPAAAQPMSREAVLASIHQARIWFERHEPSSPVPLLLRQAERLTGKRFDELFQAIPADLVERWARDEA